MAAGRALRRARVVDVQIEVRAKACQEASGGAVQRGLANDHELQWFQSTRAEAVFEQLAHRLADHLSSGAGNIDFVDLPATIGTPGDRESVVFPGFGTFEVRERVVRTGRNPQTGAAIEIPATRAPAFKPGSLLKRGLSGASQKTGENAS